MIHNNFWSIKKGRALNAPHPPLLGMHLSGLKIAQMWLCWCFSKIFKSEFFLGSEADLVFLVDSSASVGAENFYNEIKFIRKLLADFTVSYNTTRVVVITYSSVNQVIVVFLTLFPLWMLFWYPLPFPLYLRHVLTRKLSNLRGIGLRKTIG